MSGRFCESLRQKFDPIWTAQHQHPFVRGLGDGSLDPARFGVWLRQDYLFLIEYARLFALGAARAPDLDTLRWMASMTHGVLHQEMLLHEAYTVEFGLSREDLARGTLLPCTRAYSDHLLRTASLGSYLELVAALLPCVWADAEIGQRLSRLDPPPSSRYRRWIEAYSGPVATDLARQGRTLLDRLAGDSGPESLEAASEAFATSSRYEWMFWEMCYQGQPWPI